MTKVRQLFRCSACEGEFPQWVGRCPTCGEWNSLSEVRAQVPGRQQRQGAVSSAPVSLANAGRDPAVTVKTGISELDRVLGGGLVRGSVTLLGGEPGIGKSTLIMQLCASLAAAGDTCLIVTGEESVDQIGRRAQRLEACSDNVMVLAECDVEAICAAIDRVDPQLVIVDSVQTMRVSELGAAAGTVVQVRESAQVLTACAKQRSTAMILVGHVTKEGTLAGPRVLEHLVDTVLELEGDRHQELRFMRATKHRFGATDEVGVFEMRAGGMTPVADASAIFLADRNTGVAGSTVVPILQGRRPTLVEIQALVNNSNIARRVAQGLDANRLASVLGVLNKHAKLDTGMSDVYASVIGGLKVVDPATDLGVALAIASSHKSLAVPGDLVVMGEVGLTGEIRKVPHASRRLVAAARLGFHRAIVPKGELDLSSAGEALKGFVVRQVATLPEALEVLTAMAAAGEKSARAKRETHSTGNEESSKYTYFAHVGAADSAE